MHFHINWTINFTTFTTCYFDKEIVYQFIYDKNKFTSERKILPFIFAMNDTITFMISKFYFTDPYYSWSVFFKTILGWHWCERCYRISDFQYNTGNSCLCFSSWAWLLLELVVSHPRLSYLSYLHRSIIRNYFQWNNFLVSNKSQFLWNSI